MEQNWNSIELEIPRRKMHFIVGAPPPITYKCYHKCTMLYVQISHIFNYIILPSCGHIWDCGKRQRTVSFLMYILIYRRLHRYAGIQWKSVTSSCMNMNLISSYRMLIMCFTREKESLIFDVFVVHCATHIVWVSVSVSQSPLS